MIDMVGIGPFITIPYILGPMGGGRAMLAWLVGGLLAISDGLVTAELSAELPSSGGSYAFLRHAYGRFGRLVSFLFLFQILFSAPLSMASGCIGFANYLTVLVPPLRPHVGVLLAVLLGSGAAQFVTLLILWTAFASIFSLMLGYSRILYAAARDGNFFRIFASLHPRDAYPHVAILFLGVAAALFCLLPLREVVQALVSIRVLIPFIAQVIGAVILRVREPDRPRPFRMWLYPLPAIVALGLWTYVAMSHEKGLKISGLYVLAAGVVFFVAREALLKRHARAAAKP